LKAHEPTHQQSKKPLTITPTSWVSTILASPVHTVLIFASTYFFLPSLSLSLSLSVTMASSKFLERYGYDLLLGSIAAFYVIMVPYTKVEESFNIQVLLYLVPIVFSFNRASKPKETEQLWGGR